MIYDESITAFEPELIRIRRHLHANPELRFEEEQTSEDFAFYMLHKPGAYAFIGNGDGSARLPGQADGVCQLHSASYDSNDALLPLGMSYWVALAHAYLGDPDAPE
jgi:metal-dependent amidase/aminoacylase/carboxypeptidase family protein